MSTRIDVDGNFHHGSIALSIIPVNTNVEYHMEWMKVLSSS